MIARPGACCSRERAGRLAHGRCVGQLLLAIAAVPLVAAAPCTDIVTSAWQRPDAASSSCEYAAGAAVGGQAAKAIDGDADTRWVCSGGATAFPQDLVLGFASDVTFSKVRVRGAGFKTTGNGADLLLDGKVIAASVSAPTTVSLAAPVTGKTLTFRTRSSASGNDFSEVGDLDVWAATVACSCAACAAEYPTTPDSCMWPGTCNATANGCVDGGPKAAGDPCDDGDMDTHTDVCDASSRCVGTALAPSSSDARVMVSAPSAQSAEVVFSTAGRDGDARITRSPDGKRLMVRNNGVGLVSFAADGMTLAKGSSLSAPSGAVAADKIMARDVDLLAAVKALQARVEALESGANAAPPTPVGTVISSVLAPGDFAAAAGDAVACSPITACIWVLADGRDVSGSDYATATGGTSVPDLRGVFLRGMNVGRSDGKQDPESGRGALSYQSDAFQDHGHDIRYLSSATHVLFWHLNGNGHQRSSGSVAGGVQNFDPTNMVEGVDGDRAMPGNTDPRAAAETRPKNMAVYWYVRINDARG